MVVIAPIVGGTSASFLRFPVVAACSQWIMTGSRRLPRTRT
jgi:hypothetical protein